MFSKFKRSRHYVIAILLVSLVIPVGCRRFELSHTLRQFDEAIKEVRALRLTLKQASGDWQRQLDKSQLKLTRDIRETIRHDLTRLVDEGLLRVGQEFRCNVMFLEQKVLGYLEGVESALRAKRDEIEKRGGLAGVDGESLIREIILRQGRIEPCVCHVLPDTRRIHYEYRDGRATLTDREQDVVIAGMGLQRTDVPFELRLRSQGGRVRSVPNASDLLTVANSSKIVVAMNHLARHLQPEDVELSLVWEGKTLGAVGLNITVITRPQITRKQVRAEFLRGKLGELIGVWPLQPGKTKMDVEMWSTKNDAVVRCQSRFEIGKVGAQDAVFLVASFYCQEQGGDWTCFGGETRRLVFTSAPGQQVVRVVEGNRPFDTGLQRLKRTTVDVPGYPGRYGNLWGWRALPNGLPLSYWKSLEVQVDNEWKTTSAAIVGLRGTVEFTVELR